MKSSLQFNILFLSLILIFLSACSSKLPSTLPSVLVSEKQETQLGAQAHHNVLKRMKKYNDSKLQSYVNGVGQRLTKHSDRKKIRYTFVVVSDASVNAFSLPGGYVYITTGMLAYLNSEAELAGILGQEIGHVSARHGIQQKSAGGASAILARLFSKNTKNKKLNNRLLQQYILLIMRGYPQKYELQGVQLGAKYMVKAGYSPNVMIKMMNTLNAQKKFDQRQVSASQPRSYHGLKASANPSKDRKLQGILNFANKTRSVRRADNHDAYLRQINELEFKVAKKRLGHVAIGSALSKNLTYAKLAIKSIVDEKSLRLINGMYPKGQPRHGKIVKIIK